MQWLAVRHTRPSGNVPVDPLGFGVPRSVQAEPFQVIDIDRYAPTVGLK